MVSTSLPLTEVVEMTPVTGEVKMCVVEIVLLDNSDIDEEELPMIPSDEDEADGNAVESVEVGVVFV